MTDAYEFEWISLDTRKTLSAVELCRACNLNLGDLHEMVEYGSLVPLRGEGEDQLFAAECIGPLRELSKLRLDLDLDQFTMALVLGYLNRISALEQQLKSLQAQTPGQGDEAQRDA